jgi:hypothetical protein
MKKLILWIVTLAALPGDAILAQTMTGTWQGALKVPQAPNGELRTVIKISTTDADHLKAELFSIDQGAERELDRSKSQRVFLSERFSLGELCEDGGFLEGCCCLRSRRFTERTR